MVVVLVLASLISVINIRSKLSTPGEEKNAHPCLGTFTLIRNFYALVLFESVFSISTKLEFLELFLVLFFHVKNVFFLPEQE